MPSWTAAGPDRLDSFLFAQGATISRAKAQALIEAGAVSVNKKTVMKPSCRLEEGDAVLLKTPKKKADEEANAPVDMKLEVLYEDKVCMVLNKPAGVAVHPGAGMEPGEKTLLDGIAFLFKKKKIPFSPDSILAHRLDRETTGCILIAKTAKAHLALQKQFETRTVKKFYLAIVAGVPDPLSATIDAPIGRSTVNRTKMAVLGSSAMREAQTTYRTLDSAGRAALVECELHTGRTHQIRIHMLTVNHPLLGDDTYHNEVGDRLAQEHGITNLCLHARRLTFISPADKKEHTAVADLPKPFKDALKKLDLRFTA